MSDNYVYYVEKMQELKRKRALARPLRLQLVELLECVRRLEAEWTDSMTRR